MIISLINEVLSKTIITHQELVEETIFVDSNPAKVEILKISKVNSEVKKTLETNVYNLLKHKVSISNHNLEEITNILSDSINKLFIETLNKTDDIEVVNYKQKKLFGLFSKTNFDNLFSVMSYFKWAIVGKKIYKELSNLPEFEKFNNTKDFLKIGNKNDLTFFYSSDLEDDVIILGGTQPITSIFIDRINLSQESNIYEIEIEYLFLTKGIRKLILE